MDEHWRDTAEVRGIDAWETISYPANAPLTMRPDWRESGADTDPAKAAKATLDRFGFATSICNSCSRSKPSATKAWQPPSPARSTIGWRPNGWTRTRGSEARSFCPIQSPARSVEEIERRAGDPRFVQVLMLAFGEQPLGKPFYWPIYEAAERHGFTVGIHAGSSYHHAGHRLGLAQLLPGRLRGPVGRISTPSSAASFARACS